MQRTFLLALAASAILTQASAAHAGDLCRLNFKEGDGAYSSFLYIQGLSSKAVLDQVSDNMALNGWSPQVNEQRGVINGTKSFTSTFSGDHPLQTLYVKVESMSDSVRVTAITNKLNGMMFAGKMYLKNVCGPLDAIDGGQQVATTTK